MVRRRHNLPFDLLKQFLLTKARIKLKNEKNKNIQQSGFACGHPPYY